MSFKKIIIAAGIILLSIILILSIIILLVVNPNSPYRYENAKSIESYTGPDFEEIGQKIKSPKEAEDFYKVRCNGTYEISVFERTEEDILQFHCNSPEFDEYMTLPR